MGAILAFAGPIINKILAFIPDPAQKAAAQQALVDAQQAGEFKEIDAALAAMQAQTSVNAVEAASRNLFEAGWRPFIGWTCGAAMVYNFVLWPLLTWASAAFWHLPKAELPPPLDWSTMSPVLLGMLGLGTMRTVERIQGVIPKGQ